MINFEDANALIDNPDNRHRRNDKACVCIGSTGGRYRYIWLERRTVQHISVTLFGHQIASIVPDGWLIRSCGFFTPTTRVAFDHLLPYSVSMKTPGSRGGPDWESPDTGFVYFGGWDGPAVEIPSDEWLHLPEKVTVPA